MRVLARYMSKPQCKPKLTHPSPNTRSTGSSCTTAVYTETAQACLGGRQNRISAIIPVDPSVMTASRGSGLAPIHLHSPTCVSIHTTVENAGHRRAIFSELLPGPQNWKFSVER